MNSDFLKDLEERKLIHQVSAPTLGDALRAGRIVGYIGFDPSSDSLGVGNLAQLVQLMRFQRAGHRPIGLLGGGTGLIGDPSGKSAERTLNEKEVVDVFAGLAYDAERIYVLNLDREGAVLRVFAAADGAILSIISMQPGNASGLSPLALVIQHCSQVPGPEKVQEMEDSFTPGPMRLAKNGVSLYGWQFEFAGRELRRWGRSTDAHE